MLKYLLKDMDGHSSVLQSPLKVSFVSSKDAPADSLTLVFAVTGNVPPLLSVEVLDKTNRIFYGFIDTQSDECTPDGILLTVSARSLAAVLLDNEALPQTYSMVSMPLLMKRHFIPLGFTDFIGTDKTFDGEFVVSKGMSEWAVLSEFCRKFTGTSPKMTVSGLIDISGTPDTDMVYISSRQCLSKKHTLKRHLLISDVMARVAVGDGYVMPFHDTMAENLHVTRKRYMNIVDNASLSPMSAETLINHAQNSYEQVIAETAGCILCHVGTQLLLDGQDKPYIISQIHYSMGIDGEKTRIYAEVKYI